MPTFLIDNGSLRPDAVRNLRQVAAGLSARVGEKIWPVSMLHSSKIDPALLDGEEALVWERQTKRALEAGERDFYLVPFFFGPTGALEDYLPERLAVLRARYGPFRVRLAPFLFDPGKLDLVQVLAARVREALQQQPFCGPIVLCDHGSPKREVAAVRDALAAQLSRLLDRPVAPASMERRDGPEYAFNDPLLAHLLRQPGFCDQTVVVALLFLSPGRHAGDGGDIATICAEAEAEFPRLLTHRTELVGTHPAILDVLEQRYRAGLDGVREV